MTRPALLCALLLTTPAIANGDLRIHPQPQQIRISQTLTTLSSKAQINGADKADAAALDLLKAGLSRCDAGGKINRIIIGGRGDPAAASYLDGVPAKSGAYRLRIAGDLMVIAGHDERGTYYAVRSLEQLLDAEGNNGTLPEVEITDWPDIPFRGAVEGFYGTPWSHENRLSLIAFFGKHKLDTYIYGPKNDPYHSSPNWRKPYPPGEAARISELAAACRTHKVDFVWAIHPGKDIQWTDGDFQAVMAKFESMHGLGVRSFAVFFDDISGEGTKAEQQAKLLNRLQTEFVAKNSGVTPLILCPTEYNKAWSNPKPGTYLDILGENLDPSIHVMWTGNSVVADLDRSSMEWINRRIKRKAFVWWNFPVTDYVRNHLLMGPVYGNASDIHELAGGFVSNPMEHAEASKIALSGVADYAWNMKAHDPDTDWKAAIREVMPGAATAFEVFCRHNSDLGPNGHGYRREESVAFAPVAADFLAAFRQEKPAGCAAVRAELENIREAPAAIRAGSANPALIAELKPWLDAFEQLGRAGVAALDANTAMLAGNGAQVWPLLAEANMALANMAEIDRTQNRNPYQPGVRTGSLVITPLVNELVETTSARYLSRLSGRPLFRPVGITSAGERPSLPLMLDDNEDTFFYAREIQKAGDWFGVDPGGVQEVRRIRLVQGRNDQDHDRVHHGVLEGAADDRWEKIAAVETSRVDVTLDPPKKFRSVRVRVERAGSSTKPDVWTAIRSFDINPKDAAALRTDVPAFGSQPVRFSNHIFSISPMLEVHPFPPGKYLGLLLPEAVQAKLLEVDLKTTAPDKQFALEATVDGRTWKPLAATTNGGMLTATPAGKIIAVRIRNTGRTTPAVTMAKFALTLADTSGTVPLAALADSRLDTAAEIKADGTTVIRPPAGETPVALTLLISPAFKDAAMIDAIVGGQRRSLGIVKGAYARFPLPPGTSGVVLAPSGAPAVLPVSEVVWSSR